MASPMRKWSVVLGCFLLICEVGRTQVTWSLQACIDYAVQNNLSVKQAGLQARLNAVNLTAAKAALLPSLNLSGSSGYRFGLSENPTTGILQSSNYFSSGFSLSTGATLFNWFSRRHALKAAQFNEQAGQLAIRKAENDIVLQVSAAYLQALLATEMLGLAALQVQQTAKQAAATRRKITLGVLSELDAAQVQLQLLADSTGLVTAEENKARALLQLKAVLALNPDAPFAIEPLPAPEPSERVAALPELTAVMGSALQGLPELRQLAYQMEAARQRTAVAKAGRYPVLSFYGSAGSNFVNLSSAQEYAYVPEQATGARVHVNGAAYEVVAPSYKVTAMGVTPFFNQLHKNFGQNVGLTISIPLFNGKAAISNQQREEINLLQLTLQHEQLRQDVSVAIYTAYSEVEAAWRKVKLGERTVAEAASVLTAAQKRYNLNLLSTQDLLLNQTALQRAKTELLLHQYDLLFKRKLLAFYEGLPQ